MRGGRGTDPHLSIRHTVRVGIADRFAESGPYADLLDRYGMSVNDIVAAARRALARKAGAVIAADWETA